MQLRRVDAYLTCVYMQHVHGCKWEFMRVMNTTQIILVSWIETLIILRGVIIQMTLTR